MFWYIVQNITSLKLAKTSRNSLWEAIFTIQTAYYWPVTSKLMVWWTRDLKYMKEGSKWCIRWTTLIKIGHFHAFETYFASLGQLFGFPVIGLVHANASQMRENAQIWSEIVKYSPYCNPLGCCIGFVGLRMIQWVLGRKNTALHGKISTKGIGGYLVKTRVLPKNLAPWRFFRYVPIKIFKPE